MHINQQSSCHIPTGKHVTKDSELQTGNHLSWLKLKTHLHTALPRMHSLPQSFWNKIASKRPIDRFWPNPPNPQPQIVKKRIKLQKLSPSMDINSQLLPCRSCQLYRKHQASYYLFLIWRISQKIPAKMLPFPLEKPRLLHYSSFQEKWRCKPHKSKPFKNEPRTLCSCSQRNLVITRPKVDWANNLPRACEAFYVNKRSEQIRGKLRLVINYQPLN